MGSLQQQPSPWRAQSAGLWSSGTGQRLTSKGDIDKSVVSPLDTMASAQKMKKARV
jgi:hypothetical protein